MAEESLITEDELMTVLEKTVFKGQEHLLEGAVISKKDGDGFLLTIGGAEYSLYPHQEGNATMIRMFEGDVDNLQGNYQNLITHIYGVDRVLSAQNDPSIVLGDDNNHKIADEGLYEQMIDSANNYYAGTELAIEHSSDLASLNQQSRDERREQQQQEQSNPQPPASWKDDVDEQLLEDFNPNAVPPLKGQGEGGQGKDNQQGSGSGAQLNNQPFTHTDQVSFQYHSDDMSNSMAQAAAEAAQDAEVTKALAVLEEGALAEVDPDRQAIAQAIANTVEDKPKGIV